MFLEVKAATSSTSVERTLGSTGGTKLWHIIFIIIESGMTLLVIQLVRMVLWVAHPIMNLSCMTSLGLNYVLAISEMFTVIIRSVPFYFFCFAEKNYRDRASHQQ